MKKDYLRYEVRKAHIYKDIYRPSFKLSYFLGTLLSVILQGQSRTAGSELYRRRS
jgi:hypothetical protein